jgi:hypothetical protein
MYISVAGITGRLTEIDVQDDDSVEHLKAQLERELNVAAAHQQLFWLGQRIERGETTMSDLNIEVGAMFQLVVEGCEPFELRVQPEQAPTASRRGPRPPTEPVLLQPQQQTPLPELPSGGLTSLAALPPPLQQPPGSGNDNASVMGGARGGLDEGLLPQPAGRHCCSHSQSSCRNRKLLLVVVAVAIVAAVTTIVVVTVTIHEIGHDSCSRDGHPDCGSHGSCQVHGTGHTCECEDGYIGQHCAGAFKITGAGDFTGLYTKSSYECNGKPVYRMETNAQRILFKPDGFNLWMIANGNPDDKICGGLGVIASGVDCGDSPDDPGCAGRWQSVYGCPAGQAWCAKPAIAVVATN